MFEQFSLGDRGIGDAHPDLSSALLTSLWGARSQVAEYAFALCVVKQKRAELRALCLRNLCTKDKDKQKILWRHFFKRMILLFLKRILPFEGEPVVEFKLHDLVRDLCVLQITRRRDLQRRMGRN